LNPNGSRPDRGEIVSRAIGPLRPGKSNRKTQQVNKQSLESFIIGSRIALAMAAAKGSPVRSNFARAVQSKAPKKRIRRLPPVVKKQDRELTKEIARMDKVTALLTKPI
jgi:hypothetical protein